MPIRGDDMIYDKVGIETVWKYVQDTVCLREDGPTGACKHWPCDLPRRIVTEGLTPWQLRPNGRVICRRRQAATYRPAVADEQRNLVGWGEPLQVPNWLDLARAKRDKAEATVARAEAKQRAPWPKPPIPARIPRPDDPLASAGVKRAAAAEAKGWSVQVGYMVLFVPGAARIPGEANTADVGGMADGARKKKVRGKGAPAAEVTQVKAEHTIVVGRRGDEAWQAIWERRDGKTDWTFLHATHGRRGEAGTRKLDSNGLAKVINGEGG